MRRDICHFFPADVVTVYNGYLSALGNKQFDRDCREEPYFALTFGLNFSMKYNMNGGSCTVRFMPYQNGTAVNVRFSVAQLAGARYGAYDNDLTLAVEKVLGIVAQNADIDVDEFLKPHNQVAEARQVYQAPPAPTPVAPTPVVTPPPAAEPASFGFCAACGSPLREGAAFCVKCGTAVAPKEKKCQQCGNVVDPSDAFCSSCGNKL